MKRTRLLAMLLSVLMVLQLLPMAAQAAVVSESPAYTAVTELAAGRTGAPENAIQSINDFKVASGVISFHLGIADTFQNGTGTGGSTVAAVVMSAADYVGIKHANLPTKINKTTYFSADLLEVDSTYHRSGTATVTGTAGSFTASFASLGTALPKKTIAVDNHGNPTVTDNDCYYDDYVLVLFNTTGGANVSGHYVVKKFQVDSEGNLKKDSYMVRYVKNTASIGTTAAVGSTVNPQITSPSTAATTLRTEQYTRVGYTFMGWDDDPTFLQAKGTGTVLANGQGTDYVNSLASMDDATAKAGMDYPAGGSGNTVPAQTADSIYNLYAQWKPVGIGLTANTQKPGGTALETTPHDQKYDVYQAKVNKQFEWKFTVAGASGTNKGVVVESAREVEPGTETVITGGTMTAAQLLTKYGLGVATAASSKLTNTNVITLRGGTGGKVYLTGTPTTPTTNDLLVTIRTWDATNFSYATQTLRIKGVAKGAQPLPTKDDNTGLQSQIETVDDGDPDGQIYGFYSPGPRKGEDTGYQDAINEENTGMGTGSMTEYYLRKGMVFEYRPKTVESAAVDYTGLHNEGWREMPFPESWYTDAQKTPLLASMAAGAATYVKSTLKSYNTSTKVGSADTAEPVTITAWPASYGSISFNESGLPVIHGLKENDVYEIRFRANDSFGESDPTEITIGGAVASSGTTGGGGLAVNLVGGTVADDEATTEVNELTEYTKFVADAAAMTDAGTLQIPNVIPVKQYYQFAGWTTGEYKDDGSGNQVLETYPAGGSFDYTPGDRPASLAAVWNATTDAFFPIVFYDWDGVTMLGSKIVPIVEDTATQQQLIDDAMREFAESQMSLTHAAAYTGGSYDPATCTDAVTYTNELYPEGSGKAGQPRYPLSNKKGYAFGKWIDFDAKDASGNEVYTSYGKAVPVGITSGTPVDILEPAGHVYSEADKSEGIVLKAAYRTNADMEPLTNSTVFTDRNYTIKPIAFTRFAPSNNYSVTFEIRRENAAGAATHRVRKLGLRVSMKIPGVDDPVLSLFTLNNQDVVTTEVAVNAGVDSVSAEVIDLCNVAAYGGNNNWATASGARANSREVMKDATTHDIETGGFILLGNVSYINELLRGASSANDLSTLTVAQYTAAGLSTGSGTPAVRQKNARNRLWAMYSSLPTKRDLTWDEMQEAILKQTVWDPSLNEGAGGWTNGFTGTYAP